MPHSARPGLIVRAHGLWYEVLLHDGDGSSDETIIATMRGQLKRDRQRTDIVAVGDRVHVTELPDGEGAIEYVEPRTSTLIRTARNTRDTEQVILANPDQVLFVFAVRNPEPHLRMLDRFLILAERQELPVRIAVSKMDLDDPGSERSAQRLFADYRAVYPVHEISNESGAGLAELRAALQGKLTVIAGPSGVGKSSLLNALDPGVTRDVATISDATGKGRHTTIGARIYRLGPDTFIADTPGMRALAMHAIDAADVDQYFIEFRPYLGGCFYPNCTHVHEPGCPIREAVESGHIPAERYASYVALRTGEELAGT